jgi:hypothetical protein
MFQLIVVVIAIVIVAMLVIAGIYFGGEAFNDGSARASYAQNVNSAAQIEGALQLYYQDHVKYPATQDMLLLYELHDQTYLKDIPIGDWKVQPDSIYRPIDIQTVDSCRTMNRVAGYDISVVPSQYEGCPPCNGATGSQQLADAETFKSYPGCQYIPSE